MREKSTPKKPYIIIGILGGEDKNELTPDEQALIAEPLVAGAVFHTKNHDTKIQPPDLTKMIRDANEIRQKLGLSDFMACIDYEGEPWSRVGGDFPVYGALSKISEQGTLAEQETRMYTIARDIGYAFNNYGITHILGPTLCRKSGIMSKRGLAADNQTIIKLAVAFIKGVGEFGIHAVTKHAPEGSTLEDTHFEQAIDTRPVSEVLADVSKYVDVAKACVLPNIMLGHVIHSSLDSLPASLSYYWHNLLRALIPGAITWTDDFGGMKGPGVTPIDAIKNPGNSDLLICIHQNPKLLELLKEQRGVSPT